MAQSYTSHWRTRSAEIIRRVIKENPNLKDKALRDKISEAYPFGPRQYHPYKIWLSEIKAQLAGTGLVIVKEMKPIGGKWVFGVPIADQVKGGRG